MSKVLPKLLALVLALSLALMLSSTSFASDPYTGTWPDQTVNGHICANGATSPLSIAVKAGTTTIGTVELRWSATCGTNWTRVTSSIGSTQMFAEIDRGSGSDGGAVSECNPRISPCSNSDTFLTSTSIWTPQVYSPNNSDRAIGWIVYNGSTYRGCVTQDSTNLPC